MTLEQACPSEYQRAQYAFKDSMTHWNSAIRITYRISLRSSSMPEPRDPLLKVFALIKNGTQTVNTVVSEFIRVWLPAGAGQRTSYGPPAVVRRARRSNMGLVNIGLGGRA